MSLFRSLRAHLRSDAFQPNLIGILVSPVYIIRRGLFSSIAALAPAISGDVLDFGCGSKPYESLFSSAKSYTGVDLETTGHDHIDSKVDVFYDGSILPFADAQFDAVLAFEVFEHVFNLPTILKEIARVTRREGHLLISIPFAWHEHESPYDFARYTRFGISHILNDAGYDVVEIKRTTTYVLAIFQMFEAYLIQNTLRSKLLRSLRQACIIFPCTLIAYTVDAVLPDRGEYYCNLVVLAKKSETR